jgi:DNA adenine methylase
MMPPHDVYIELFAGSAAILRRKRPAARSFAYDLNVKTLADLASHLPAEYFEAFQDARFSDLTPWTEFAEPGLDRINLTLYRADALAALDRYAAGQIFWGLNDPARALIYADPPYLAESRKSKKPIYDFEMLERSKHIELLDKLAAVPCMVMISGYENPLYNRKLKAWRKETIPTVNRAGERVIETVWLNFPEPYELHDYEHVGKDFRDRWRIEKKARNWVRQLANMPALERYAILGRLNELKELFATTEDPAAALAAAEIARKARRKVRESKPAVTPDPLSSAEPGELFELKRCQAARDGECNDVQCPQLRDGEPAKTGRHCPLDVFCEDYESERPDCPGCEVCK